MACAEGEFLVDVLVRLRTAPRDQRMKKYFSNFSSAIVAEYTRKSHSTINCGLSCVQEGQSLHSLSVHNFQLYFRTKFAKLCLLSIREDDPNRVFKLPGIPIKNWLVLRK